MERFFCSCDSDSIIWEIVGISVEVGELKGGDWEAIAAERSEAHMDWKKIERFEISWVPRKKMTNCG